MKRNEKEITIPIGKVQVKGNLAIPANTHTMVIFSHGSGSSRFSPRNGYVAGVLNEHGFATLLIDLLTPQEDEVYEARFDIELLTQRLKAVTEYILEEDATQGFKIGYFGASTGAASALNAAAGLKDKISAVVSRGGRPDLAERDLPSVKAPVLLIVGSLDGPVIEMNEYAYDKLRCEKQLVIVEGATHLFEEKGKLEEVAKLATAWFEQHLK